jgi:exosortase D (VPLPA-CTERM-specific)
LNNIGPVKVANWLKVAVYGLLLYFAYRSALVYLLGQWKIDDFTYCAMVPFVAIYLIREKRERLAATPSVPSWKGIVPLTIGLAFFWLGELSGEFTMLFLSLWLVVISLCWLHLGWRKLKVISFPLSFSIATFVPPHALYDPLTLRLKLISSQLSVHLMQLYGLSAYREGNVIDLGFTRLQVVDACSGLRYVIPLLLMGVLMAYYLRVAFWKRALLVASTVPLSIVTNSLRIASVGILYQFWGPAVAEGFFHDLSGWFIFMAGLGFLLLEMWLLKKIFKGRGTGEARRETLKAVRRETEDVRCNVSPLTSSVLPPLLRPPQFLAATAALLLTIALANMVDFREKTPLVKPFSGFPIQIGEWSGIRTGMEQEFLDTLNLSDYAMIDYRNPEGKEISFYAAFNATQSKGEATHSPASCLPSNGWVFRESGTTVVPGAAKGEKTLRVCRAFMEKNGVRQLVYFWFPQRGRDLTSLYQVKFFNFWDALTRQRTDGALVRVITPVYQTEQVEDAEQRLVAFTGQAAQLLTGFIPK